jgi:2-polyprenyl-3-methyl-5-hydroxy-6-metoxy-1,4-benzoquinol methylase
MKLVIRAEHEIEHGKILSQNDPESIWGWGTPAGKLRARRRAELIVSGASLDPQKRVLEIGCGTGMFTEIFAQTGANILAVDISPDLLQVAQKRGLPIDRVKFLEKRFEDCDVDEPFDAVIGSSVLHHLELNEALAKIYSLLKPGGCMSFAEPNMLNPQVFLERKFHFLRSVFWYVSPDETAFVRWQLHKSLAKAGFETIRIAPFDWLHPATPPTLIPLVKKLGALFEKMPGMREFAGSVYIRAVRPM